MAQHAPDEVVDDDTPSGQPVERPDGPDDLVIGEVMKKESARHVVERSVATRCAMHITTEELKPFVVAPTPCARQCSRADVESRHLHSKSSVPSPGDQVPREVSASACDIEHVNPLAGSPLSAERLEPTKGGPPAAEPPIDRSQKGVYLVDDRLRWRVVVQNLSLQRA